MIAAIRAAGARILDNAMLYKDITQWLRNKTFLVLFFGLLAAAEGFSLFIMALGEEIGRPGAAVFSVLYFVLLLYGFVIAYMGHSLTSREFLNRTFELYELSGMSLERMIGGKFLSMVYQFYFGFFCIVPFLFFAYFLGGLDFLDVVSGMILVSLIVPPVYLIALLTALTTKLKQIATLGKIAAVGLVVLFSFFGFISIFSRSFFGTYLFDQITELLKQILSGNRDVLLAVAVFLVFYLQLCLLLFYLCCHMVSRETDSREVAIKVLCLTLTLSWLGLIATMSFLNSYEREVPVWALLPVYGLFGLTGLLLFFSPMRIPVIVKNRYREGRRRKRLFFWIFQPGPRGMLRYLLLVIAVCALYSFGMYSVIAAGWVKLSTSLLSSSGYTPGIGAPSHGVATSYDSWTDWVRMLSYLIQLPFFISFPIGFFTAFFPKVRENVAVQRTLVACWWGFAGAVVAFYATWARMYRRDYSALLEFASLIVSPISSFIVTGNPQSPMHDFGIYVRVGLGILGIYLMHGILRRRAREEAAEAGHPVGSITSSSVDTGAPA